MSCDVVMCSHLVSCHLLTGDAMQWDGILWVCDATWLVAMSRCVVMVVWCNELEDDLVIRTTKDYSVQPPASPNCTSHEQWLSSLVLLTYETSFTIRGATGINFRPHQILHLPRKLVPMIYVRHKWNVVYIAQSNRWYCTCHENPSHGWSSWHIKRHLQCYDWSPNMTGNWYASIPALTKKNRTIAQRKWWKCSMFYLFQKLRINISIATCFFNLIHSSATIM